MKRELILKIAYQDRWSRLGEHRQLPLLVESVPGRLPLPPPARRLTQLAWSLWAPEGATHTLNAMNSL